jgi:hypothetical protein
MSKLILPGINIQYPISQLIVRGEKKLETRTYPLPKKYIGKDLFLVETPGRDGKFKARIVGIIKFEASFEYDSKIRFYKDFERHRVNKSSQWAWKDKAKWGWPIAKFKALKSIPLGKRTGIVFTQRIQISLPS